MPYKDEHGAERVAIVNRGYGWAIVGTSGVVAAALAQDAIIFAMRADPLNTAPVGAKLTVENFRVAFTTIAAFTTPVTAARQLAIYRAAGAACTGGTTITPVAKNSADLGGYNTGTPAFSGISDARIATTAALGVAGVVREANKLGELNLVHVGAAGGYIERIWEFHPSWNIPPTLQAGELLVVSNPVAMDAGGTFQIAVDAHYTIAQGM